MTDVPSGSGSSTPKAIGSLAKKQSDVTRQGTQKLKFVPTLPQRRKKEEVKAEPTSAPIPSISRPDRGRGRGRGQDGPGRSRGRGGPPVIEMTASGPFAMGPALAGAASRRSTPRSNFARSVAPSNPGSASAVAAGLSHTAPPSLAKDSGDGKGKAKVIKDEDEDEVYSDPDEGVEIVDINDVRQMDWMAPESLQKEKQPKKAKKEKVSEEGDIDVSNALDLSDNDDEEEVELEDIIEDFAAEVGDPSDASFREERLYLFQFPSPFPTFASNPAVPSLGGDLEMADGTDIAAAGSQSSKMPSPIPLEPPKIEVLGGVIGHLEVYRSGSVKMRLGNGILFDVNPATQPSFLQQATCLDMEKKQLKVIGEVNKQFVVSPNIDVLLEALEEADRAPPPLIEGEENLMKMDGI